MAPKSEKITFPGFDGSGLAGKLDLPSGTPLAYALWAHCFSCSKDVFAASRVARSLTERGIAVLRFDFTGLGTSEGDFANTNFSSNVQDLIAATDYLRAHFQAPKMLIGHSLGGAAILAAAPHVPEALAVCTIGAPSDPAHVADQFSGSRDDIENRGQAEVSLAGRPFTIKKQFLDDIEGQKLEQSIASMKKALLVFHSPIDAVVGIENAGRIFQAAKHPKSFVTLDKADHMLSNRQDAAYVADVIATWATRYLDAPQAEAGRPATSVAPGTVVVEETGKGKFANTVSIGGKHSFLADEPVSYGGTDTGPTPYDLLLAGLGACKAMTMRMYAERKGFPMEQARVTLKHDKIHAEDCDTCETKSGRLDRIVAEIEVIGDMDAETRQKIVDIADKCPVHKTLHSEVLIESHQKP